MVNMSRDMKADILQRIRFEGRVFATIKYVLKASLNQTLWVNLMKENHFACEAKLKRNVVNLEEGRTVSGFDTEGYRKIQGGNAIVCAHLKRGNSDVNSKWRTWSPCAESRSSGELDRSQGFLTKGVHVQLLRGIW